MPIVSGIDVKDLNVKMTGGNPIISVNFKPAFPTLIDVTASSASGHILGRAIINDTDPNNNLIALNGFKNFIDQIIWLRIVVFHPSLKQFDFNVLVNQDANELASLNSKGALKGSIYKYEGFILRGGAQ